MISLALAGGVAVDGEKPENTLNLFGASYRTKIHCSIVK
jgi:hypothetical protein